MKNTQQPKACEYCGTVFMVQAKKLLATDPRHRIRYCSRRCLGYAHSIHNLKPLTKPNSTSFKQGQNMGKDNPMYVEPIAFTCENCNEVFAIKPSVLHSSGGHRRFCSAKCRGEYRTKFESGSASSMWVGGIKTYRGRNWKRARLLAVERDNGACQQCGRIVGKSIPVHHVRPFREFTSAEEANQLDNLACLCQSCHMHLEPRGNHTATSQMLG